MIRYSLNLNIEPCKCQITPDSKIVLLGSCFTEHIGQRLQDLNFDVSLNPNGVVFNPISLAESIKRILKPEKYSLDDLVYNDNKWVSLYHHGKFSSSDPEICLANVNKVQEAFEHYIASAQWLIVTFGTAWVYEYKERNTLVANCHKIPQTFFNKRLLEVNEIVKCWKESEEILKKINPSLKIIYTVSPVKHLRDGVHENSLSKATLLLAIEQLLQNRSYYFPAYELVIDDLRDYRFFDQDGAHPNSLAIDYVFEAFKAAVLSKESNEMVEQLEKYFKLKNHRPLDHSDENISYLSGKIETLKSDLMAHYPHLKGKDL